MTDTREPASQSSEQLRTDDDIVRYVVANAIWAPSVHNTQPWKFSAEGATDYEYELMRQNPATAHAPWWL